MIIDLLFPRRCASCDEWGRAPLCHPCERGVRWITAPICARCGRPTRRAVPACRDCKGHGLAFRLARAAAVYAGPARDALKAFKLSGERRHAHALARPMLSAADGLRADVITFVPATRAALLARGFNPAEELGRRIAASCGLPLSPLLEKVRETADQTGLGREDRRANLAGAFRAAAARGRVLLVDDVYTTGATADACAAALREAGAVGVDVLTFARAL